MAFFSCEKNDISSLDVQVDTSLTEGIVKNDDNTYTIMAGSSVTFNVNSDAQMILCYPGDAGHDYNKRNNTVADGVPQLDFSYAPNRVYDRPEIEMSVLVSTDLDGTFDEAGLYKEENIKNATWSDLTPQEMKDYRNSNTSKAMPTVSLSEYKGETPIFVAYRLKVISSDRFVNPTISNFKISNVSEDGSSVTVCDGVGGAGFKMITISDDVTWKEKGSGNSYWKISSNTITVNTQPFTNASDGKSHELWAISNCIYLSNASPDTGITVRDIQENSNTFTYQYDKPGKYDVYFVAYNTGVYDDVSSNVSHIVINVE